MKKIHVILFIIISALVTASCLFAPENVLERDNPADPLNPVNIESSNDTLYKIALSITGKESGENLTASLTEATAGTAVTLTASLNSDKYRMVSLDASGAELGKGLILSSGGISTFTMPAADVTVNAEFTDRNIEKIIHAGDLQANDRFGYSVDISGDYAIVGAYCEDDGSGTNLLDAGAVYIYKNDGSGNWTEIETLYASDLQAGDNFGGAVGISGDYAIVGAQY